MVIKIAGEGILYNPCPKINPYRNKEYLRFIRTKPSLKSSRYGTEFDPIEACHQNIDGGCMGGKPSDLFTIPLLKSEHALSHQAGHETFFNAVWDITEEWLMQSMLVYINEYFYQKSIGVKF